MVMSPSFRKCSLLPLSLGLLALAGCNNAGTPGGGGSPQAASTPVPSSAPGLKSATPNSFDEVAAQLNPGGDLYAYIGTAQYLTKLTQWVDSLHAVALSGTEAPEEKAEIDKAFAIAKNVVEKSGVEEISGIGASSIALESGLHLNKLFVHHYAGQGKGIIWSVYGKAPHALTGLDFMPADTALTGVGDLDLPWLVSSLKKQAEQSGFPEAKETIDQWQTQFEGITGLKFDDVMNSLNGSMGMLLTLDASNTFTIPIPSGPQTIPLPRLGIMLAVKNDLIFKQVDKMAGANPGVIKVDQPDLKMRTMPVPVMPGLGLRPTVAQWNGFLIIASDDKLVQDLIAAQKSGQSLKATPEFTKLSAGMPATGNSFGFCSQRFVDVVKRIQSQAMTMQPGTTPAQMAALQQMMMKYQQTGPMYTVSSEIPNGRLTISQGSQGAAQFLAPMVILPAIAAGASAAVLYKGVHPGF